MKSLKIDENGKMVCHKCNTIMDRFSKYAVCPSCEIAIKNKLIEEITKSSMEPNNPKQTPTPLVANPAEWLGDHSTCFEANVFDNRGILYASVIADSEDEANRKADEIVRSVSVHEELLGLLRSVLSDCDDNSGGCLFEDIKRAITKAEER